jgi:hypothetical protein
MNYSCILLTGFYFMKSSPVMAWFQPLNLGSIVNCLTNYAIASFY